MSGSKVSIPSEFTIHLNPVHLEGSVGVDATVSSPPGQPLVINAGLDDIGLSLTGSRTEPVTVDLGLDKICLSLAITEIPRIQVHVPTRYDIGFCLFGIPIFNLTLAGETLLLTQDNPVRMVHRPPPGAPAPGHDRGYAAGAADESPPAVDVKVSLGDDCGPGESPRLREEVKDG
jgi:hypothetical protein